MIIYIIYERSNIIKSNKIPLKCRFMCTLCVYFLWVEKSMENSSSKYKHHFNSTTLCCDDITRALSAANFHFSPMGKPFEIFISNICMRIVETRVGRGRGSGIQIHYSLHILLPTFHIDFPLFKYLTNEICPRPLEYSKLGIYSLPFEVLGALSLFFFLSAQRSEIVFETLLFAFHVLSEFSDYPLVPFLIYSKWTINLCTFSLGTYLLIASRHYGQ